VGGSAWNNILERFWWFWVFVSSICLHVMILNAMLFCVECLRVVTGLAHLCNAYGHHLNVVTRCVNLDQPLQCFAREGDVVYGVQSPSD
jgi:hypothetical protein